MPDEFLTGASHLFNTGGPFSRVRTEQVHSSILEQYTHQQEPHPLVSLPSALLHSSAFEQPRIWLEQQLMELGLRDSFTEGALLPKERSIIRQQKDRPEQNYSPLELVVNALILGKCNDFYYHPDQVWVPTYKRLSRTLQFISFQPNLFYEID